MRCQYCKSRCVKIGKQKDGTQKFRCKGCKKHQQEEYKYQAKIVVKRKLVTKMIVNNAGFRGIARVLAMSYNTVHKTVMDTAKTCKPSKVPEQGVYEVDEVMAYHKKGIPQIWAAYAIERFTKQVIGISVGPNNKSMLRKTIDAILITNPRLIFSDGNPSYKRLIPTNIHRRTKRFLKFIERLHLTVRNKLKMMNRKTFAFVRKESTLTACLKLLFWSV